MTRARRPTVAILGTGGTIAGSRSSTDGIHYQPATLGIDELIATVPGLDALADLRSEQIFQVDSINMDDAAMLALARRTAETLADDDVDAAVVTHGTDTLEESSYLLHLTLKTHKPVVFVASMRPGDGLGADGPRNLRSAVAVAASEQSIGMGVFAVMNDEIHTARDASKTHTLNVSALRSPHGPLGYVVGQWPLFYRAPIRPHTERTAFHLDAIAELPQVDVIYGHSGMSTTVIDALIGSSTSAIIYAGMGNGNMSDVVQKGLQAARASGIHVARASRAGHGPVLRNAAVHDDDNDWIAVDDQTPQKARLLMALGLTTTQDAKDLQQLFWTY